jgi:hypothetical protein
MRATLQNSGTSLSIGVFFSLMIAGLASSLPQTLSAGLRAHGVPAATAAHLASLPPVSSLFAAFLGNNPISHLLGPGVLNTLPRMMSRPSPGPPSSRNWSPDRSTTA